MSLLHQSYEDVGTGQLQVLIQTIDPLLHSTYPLLKHGLFPSYDDDPMTTAFSSVLDCTCFHANSSVLQGVPPNGLCPGCHFLAPTPCR